MKTRRIFPLLLWFCFSLSIGLPCANGQDPEARGKLISTMEKVREIAKGQKNRLADVANEYFEGKEFDNINPDTPEFRDFVTALKTERDKIEPNNRKELARTITILEADYKTYNELKTGGANGSSNAVGGTGNAAGTGGGSNATNLRGGEDESWTLSGLLVPAAAVLGSLIVIGLIVFSVMLLLSLQRASDALAVSLPQQFNGVKTRHEELSKQVAAFAVVNNGINQRLADLHSEIRQVSRGLQLSQQNARGGTSQASTQAAAATSYAEPVAEKRDEMPSFPIAADDFLRRMQPKSMVVKRDFQNDILVSDPDGKGELVLIRDARIPDEIQPLFIVPSVTQFQMRQEYYNFYEKYYDCTNPESGTLWIIDPAVVDKVSGGWQLREKGRLEVR